MRLSVLFFALSLAPLCAQGADGGPNGSADPSVGGPSRPDIRSTRNTGDGTGQGRTGGHGGGKKSGKGGSGTQLSLPLSQNGLHGTFGGYRAYSAQRSQAFYSIGYGATSLFTHGNVYSGTRIADADPIDFGGDPVDLEIANGKSQIGGTVVHSLTAIPINAFKIRSLPMFKVRDPSVRILIGFDGQTESAPQQHLLFGIEYRPHLNTAGAPAAKGGARSAPKSGGDQERFIGIGFATEKHVDNQLGINETVPAAVLRGRLGIGFDFVTSRSRIEAARQAAQAALGQVTQAQEKLQTLLLPKLRSATQAAEGNAPFDVARDNARNLATRFGMNPSAPSEPGLNASLEGGETPVQERLSLSEMSRELDGFEPPKGPETAHLLAQVATNKLALLSDLAAIYKAFLALGEKGAASSLFKNAPRLSLFAEYDGSYALDRSVVYARYRNIWSANVKLDLDPANAGAGFVLLRYENGFSRAEPNVRANALTLTVGFSFP